MPEPPMLCPACPSCGATRWHRDGYRMERLDCGPLVAVRDTLSSDPTAPWLCGSCMFTVPRTGILHARLNGAQLRGAS
jgi:hypothetical protein